MMTVRELIVLLLQHEMDKKVFFDFEENLEGRTFRAKKVWENDSENIGVWIG
jgi:hypothetical protein